MVKKIISERRRVEIKEKRIDFDLASDRNSGFTFDADDNFNPIFSNEVQKKNYDECLGNPDYIGPIKHIQRTHYIENAKAICECGKEIELWDQYQGACECDYCGRWHNLYGQTLLSPEHWEE